MLLAQTPLTEDPPELRELEGVFDNLLRAVFALAGIATLVYLLIGGFGYLTAVADQESL